MTRHSIFAIAKAKGREYITPEDVTDSFDSGYPAERVRMDVLRTLGRVSGFGAEDESLCAFVASKGPKRRRRSLPADRPGEKGEGR